MKRIYRIELKNVDLARSRDTSEQNCKTCPFAFAMMRATGVPWGVSRSGAYSKKYGRISFPPFVTAWIDFWDLYRKGALINFSVALDEPEPQAVPHLAYAAA